MGNGAQYGPDDFFAAPGKGHNEPAAMGCYDRLRKKNHYERCAAGTHCR
jgi:hypothetical protein